MMMMTAREYGVTAATVFNGHRPGHFPGRPLLEGLVANAVRAAVRVALVAITVSADPIALAGEMLTQIDDEETLDV